MNTSGHRRRQAIVCSVIAATLLLGGVVSAAYSIYWFIKAQEPKAELA